MPQSLVLLLLLVPLLAAQAPPASDDQVAEWFQAAQQAKAGGDLARAEAEYRKVIRARPQIAEAHSNLGVVHYLENRCGDAVTDFQQALRYRPNLDVPLLFSGICFEKMRQYGRAIPLLKRALAARPGQPEVYLYLGLAYSGADEEKLASEWFERYAEQNPKEPEALYQLGGSYLRLSAEALRQAGRDSFWAARGQAELGEEQGRALAQVEADYGEAIRLRPAYPNLHWGLARVYLRNGKPQLAAQALAAELALDPDHLPALLLSAELARRAGRLADQQAIGKRIESIAASAPRSDANFARMFALEAARAMSLLNSMLELDGSSPLWGAPADLTETTAAVWRRLQPDCSDDRLLEIYSRLRVARGELPLLRDQLAPQVRSNPGRKILPFLLAKVYRQLSLAAYSRMAEAAPRGYQTLLLKAETLEGQHQDEAAEQAYRDLLQAKPDATGAHYQFGALLLRRHKGGEAMAEFERAVAADPYDTRARVALAEAYIDQRQPERAVTLLRQAVQQDPASTPGLLALARAYLLEQKPELAAPLFARAVELDPEDVNAHYQLAQTYQDLGKTDAAAREFAAVRRLRAARRR